MQNEAKQIIRFPELSKKLGKISRSSIYRWVKHRDFPCPIELGSNSKGWFLHEVESWLSQQAKLGGQK